MYLWGGGADKKMTYNSASWLLLSLVSQQNHIVSKQYKFYNFHTLINILNFDC